EKIDAPLLVRGDQRHARGIVQHDPEIFLALAQSLLNEVLLGDIGMGADDADWFASLIPVKHTTTIQYPLVAAILAAQPILAAVHFGPTFDVLPEIFPGLPDITGMH